MFDFLRRLFAPAHPDPLAGLPNDVRVIVGLGNPGKEYAFSRHNLGFMCVDELAQRFDAAWVDDVRRTRSLLAVAQTEGAPLLLCKPQTFMNRSGEALQPLREVLELKPRQMLVVYDEMDLPLGVLRLRERGSPGTHNGMRSVVNQLGDDVPRLRIGIGQSAPGAAIDHVLGEFTPDEEAQIDELIGRAADAAYAWATESAAVAMNRYNKN